MKNKPVGWFNLAYSLSNTLSSLFHIILGSNGYYREANNSKIVHEILRFQRILKCYFRDLRRSFDVLAAFSEPWIFEIFELLKIWEDFGRLC